MGAAPPQTSFGQWVKHHWWMLQLIITIIAGGSLAFLAWTTLSDLSSTKCTEAARITAGAPPLGVPPTAEAMAAAGIAASRVLPDLLLALVGGLSLFVGGLTGHWRGWDPGSGGYPEPRKDGYVLATGASVLALLIATIALTYEVSAVARLGSPGAFQPITQYVRCAVFYSHPVPVLTYLSVAGYCLLFGQWLWYPPPRLPMAAGYVVAAVACVAAVFYLAPLGTPSAKSLAEPVGQGYDKGVPLVVIVPLGIALLISALDVILEKRNSPPIGYYVQAWSSSSPWLASLLLGVIAAMLVHFFGNPI